MQTMKEYRSETLTRKYEKLKMVFEEVMKQHIVLAELRDFYRKRGGLIEHEGNVLDYTPKSKVKKFEDVSFYKKEQTHRTPKEMAEYIEKLEKEHFDRSEK